MAKINKDIMNIDIIELEDELLEQYECNVPSKDVTAYLIEQKRLFELDKDKYISNCTKLEDVI
jgi:hypothetical protein